MGRYLSAEVAIKGKRSLLWCHFGPDAIPLEKQERTGVAGNDPDEWRRTVLMTPGRQLYLDPSQAFGCIRDGARYIRVGRGSLQPMVGATVQVTDEVILVDRYVPDDPIPTSATEPVYIDIRSCRNPSTKARNLRYRIAASPGWQTTFHLFWDSTIIARGQMETILRDAGNLVGIGDGRPIGFGRFDVTTYEVSQL